MVQRQRRRGRTWVDQRDHGSTCTDPQVAANATDPNCPDRLFHDHLPGTRIPALVIDHTAEDTTSIVATIEKRFGLAPLSTRDAAVNDLSRVLPGQAAAG